MRRHATGSLFVILFAACVGWSTPDVAGEKDTHYWLTMKLALLCNFSLPEARLIAAGDWGMDEGKVVAEGRPDHIAKFTVDHWPNDLGDDGKVAIQRAGEQATVDQGASSKEGTMIAFGEQLNFQVGGILVDAYSASSAQATQTFTSSQQHRFHAFPLDKDDNPIGDLQAGQQSLETRFTTVANAQKSEKLVKFGQFLHFVQDKWHHWPHLTGAGHGGPTIDGQDPDSAKIAQAAKRYRRMADESVMWLGELKRQLGQASACGDGVAGVVFVGPWKVADFDTAAQAEIKLVAAQRTVITDLLNSIAKKSNPAWKDAPVARGFLSKKIASDLTYKEQWKILNEQGTIKKKVKEAVDALAEIVVAEIKKELPQAQQGLAKVAGLEWPKKLKFDVNGGFPTLDDSPAAALVGLVAASASEPNVVADAVQGLTLSPAGAQTKVDGAVTLLNDGGSSTAPGDAFVAFLDFGDGERLIGEVGFAVPSLAPGASQSFAYTAYFDGNYVGHQVVASGLVSVDEAEVSDNAFVDAATQLVASGSQVTLTATPVVPFLPLSRILLSPCAVTPDDDAVLFRVRFPKAGGPAAMIVGSVLTVHVNDQVLTIPQSGSVAVPAGVKDVVELAFGPVDLESVFSGIPSIDTPDVLTVGVEVKGTASGSVPFRFLQGPLYVGVTPATPGVQPIYASQLQVKLAANPMKDKLVFSSSDVNALLPGGADAPTLAGAHLRIFDTADTAGDFSHCLPPSGWKTLTSQGQTTGYKYTGTVDVMDPCKTILLKRSGTKTIIKATCRLAGVDLHPPFTGNAAVILDIGGARYCAELVNPTANGAGIYKAKKSPPPGVCPPSPSEGP
jgi:hypothetical protein